MIQPLADMPKLALQNIKYVLTDIDDTLTWHGRLPAAAYGAMEKLQNAGIKILPITGRPAGWCDHIARMWPVEGVVGENGAFYFRYDVAAKKMLRIYAQDAMDRHNHKGRLGRIAADVLQKFPGTAMASDQAYREVDVAIDFAEDVKPLPLATATLIADYFHEAGAAAKVSSIHVNAWIGTHDKLTMSLRFLQQVFDLNSDSVKVEVSYVGDSPNDAPMFAHFPHSVGVANLMPFANLMTDLPRYITKGEGGAGFAEFADLLLKAQNKA